MNENISDANEPRGTDPVWSIRVKRVTFFGSQQWRIEFFSDHALLKSRNGRRVVRFPDPGSGVSHQFKSQFLRGFNFKVTTPDGTLKFDVPPGGIAELTRLAEWEQQEPVAAAPPAPPPPAEPRVLDALILDDDGLVDATHAMTSPAAEPAVIEPLVFDDIAAPDATIATAEGAPAADGAAAEPAADESAARRAAMHKDLKGWCIALIILGAVSIVFSEFLDPIWGGVLIAAGIAGFFIRRRGMFIAYGVVLLLAGVLNILSGHPGWLVFGVLQVWWAVQEFRKFVKYAGVGGGRDPASGATE